MIGTPSGAAAGQSAGILAERLAARAFERAGKRDARGRGDQIDEHAAHAAGGSGHDQPHIAHPMFSALGSWLLALAEWRACHDHETRQSIGRRLKIAKPGSGAEIGRADPMLNGRISRHCLVTSSDYLHFRPGTARRRQPGR